MTFRAPSRKQMVLLFLIVGPMLWPYALSLAGPHSTAAMNGIYGTSLLNYISLIFIGFGAWWMFAWAPTFWLSTWVPTVLAALASERALHIVCRHYRARMGSRALLIVISSIACAVISVAIFAPLQWLAFRPSKVSDMASLSQLVWMVAIIGAFLGVVAGAWPRLTPSIADAASPLN